MRHLLLAFAFICAFMAHPVQAGGPVTDSYLATAVYIGDEQEGGNAIQFSTWDSYLTFLPAEQPDVCKVPGQLVAFDGMQTANQSLQQLVEAHRVTPEDALAQSIKPNELAQALRGRT